MPLLFKCSLHYVPPNIQVDDASKRDEIATLFGLTPEERQEVLGAAAVALDRIRQQHGEDDDSFF